MDASAETESLPESIPETDDKQPHLKHPEVEAHAEVIGQKPKTRKRRNTFIFLLGSLCGIVAAGFFASTNDLIEFPEIGELSLDSVLDVLPAGMVREYRDLIVCVPSRLVGLSRGDNSGWSRIANRAALLLPV